MTNQALSSEDVKLPEVMTMPDVARYLRISRSAAYELAHDPSFPAIRIGRTIRVRRDAFLHWLQRKENSPAGSK
ncbi:helix-turn-helix domain-containing protein [Calderihabitans maritimus]|uniref:DNA binding domain protein, excisionase family n=1 Tax=Calderihabitans maritimus TaxID=1246530 RepID=A0A1Z5HSS5_9FIRM|nr:helix-turn-helix domain-containing protein [Calderihabitans maritimus]GAW92488.1 DNA binding domain protein, excisionase family [Calderihabitans maritimus]